MSNSMYSLYIYIYILYIYICRHCWIESKTQTRLEGIAPKSFSLPCCKGGTPFKGMGHQSTWQLDYLSIRPKLRTPPEIPWVVFTTLSPKLNLRPCFMAQFHHIWGPVVSHELPKSHSKHKLRTSHFGDLPFLDGAFSPDWLQITAASFAQNAVFCFSGCRVLCWLSQRDDHWNSTWQNPRSVDGGGGWIIVRIQPNPIRNAQEGKLV